MSEKTRINLVCDNCGSCKIVRDSTAEWNVRNQRWELAGLLDDVTCNSCGHSKVSERPIGKLTQFRRFMLRTPTLTFALKTCGSHAVLFDFIKAVHRARKGVEHKPEAMWLWWFLWEEVGLPKMVSKDPQEIWDMRETWMWEIIKLRQMPDSLSQRKKDHEGPNASMFVRAHVLLDELRNEYAPAGK